MKKRVLTLLLALVLVVALLPMGATAATNPKASMALSIPAGRTDSTLEAGDIVTLTVSLPALARVCGISFVVGYDQAKYTYNGSPTSGLTNFAPNSDIQSNATAGTVTLAYGYTDDTQYALAAGSVLVLSFTVKSEVRGAANFTCTSLDIDLYSGADDGYSTTAKGIVDAPAAYPTTIVQRITSPIALTGTVTTPAKGATNASSLDGSGADADKVDVAVAWTPALTDNKFAGETTYTATITVSPSAGYVFGTGAAISYSDYTFAKDNVTGNFVATKQFPETAGKELTKIEITGGATGTVPTVSEIGGTETAQVAALTATGTFDDTSTANLTGNAVWSVVGNPVGVSVNTQGIVSLTNKAAGGTVTIKAVCAGKEDTHEIVITRLTPQVAFLKVSGDAEIVVPNATVGTNTETYTIAAYDQYGDSITAPATGVTWSLTSAPTGANIDASTDADAVVSVVSSANVPLGSEVSVGVKAEYSAVSDTLTIKVSKALPKPTTIELTAGPTGNVDIPTAAVGTTTATAFTAKVLDQYGVEMLNQSIVWSIEPAVPGTSVANGALTVTTAAANNVTAASTATVTVKATCGEASKTKNVTIARAASAVTEVKVCSEKGVVLTSDTIYRTGKDITATYTAKVFDQYGIQMPAEIVTWAVTGGTVVSVNNGVVTIMKDAKAGQNFTLEATSASAGTVKGDCLLRLTEQPAGNVFTVTVKASEGGEVYPEGTYTIEDGGERNVFFTPDEGYRIESILVNGMPVDPAGLPNVGGNTKLLALSNVKANTDVAVTFSKIPEAVTPDEPETPVTPVEPETPDTPVTPVDPAKPTPGKTDVFKFYGGAAYFTVTATSTANGKLSYDDEAVRRGGSVDFILTPDAGAVLKGIYVDGANVIRDATYWNGKWAYTLSNVKANTNVTAVFVKPASYLAAPTGSYVGEAVNTYEFTDIVCYINGKPVRSYNIDGYTVVVAEDLRDYGFYVAWDSAARELAIVRNFKAAVAGSEAYAATALGEVGKTAGNVLYTDIVTTVGRECVKISSFNINGYTCIDTEYLKAFCSAYTYNNATRTLDLTLAG